MAMEHAGGAQGSTRGLLSSVHDAHQAGDGRPGRNSARSTRAAGTGAWLALLLLLVLAVLPTAARAQLATGGIGIYRDNIVWFSWGVNGTDVPQAGLTQTNSINIAGQFLRTTCTLSNIVGGVVDPAPSLRVFTPGAGGGNQLDTLYNSGGVDAANTMAIGLTNRNITFSGNPAGEHVVNFSISCSATFGPTDTAADPPYAMDGLVMADAEGSTATESISATIPTSATWRIIETYSPPGCTIANSARATLVVTGANQELRLSGQNTFCSGQQKPATIAFMEGVSAADLRIQGDGRTAIAVGVFVNVSDQGDMPASYGDPQHLPQFVWSGGTVPVTPDHSVPNGTFINDPSFTPAVRSAAAVPRFGATVDTEITAIYDPAALADDANGIDDEDALSGPVVISGGTLNGVPCTGTGAAVSGFIDWNADGDFTDPGETSVPTTCPAGGSVNLTWSTPGALEGPSYLRLRIAPNAVEVAGPDGVAGGGEVEDYAVTLIPSQITLVKQLNGRVTAVDQFTVSIENPTPVSVTTTGSGVNGTSTVSTPATPVDAGTPIVLRDALTAGAGAFGTYAKSIVCVANAGNVGAVPVINGPVMGATTADWTLTPTMGNDLTCTITNAAPEPTFTISKALTGESGNDAGVAEPGEQLTYTITVTNTSVVDAAGVLITDPIPANTTFVSASDGGGVVGGDVQWTLDIPANTAMTRTVVFQVVNPIPSSVTQIANSATVDDPGDTNPPTSCATLPCVTTPVAAPAQTLVKALTGNADGDASGTITVGDVLTYTITMTNTGNVTLANVTVNDTLITPNTITCASVAPGATCVLVGSYTATQADSDAGSISNTATSTSPVCPVGSIDPACTQTLVTPIAPTPAQTLAKALTGNADGDASGTVTEGDVLTYTVTMTNTGNVTLANVTVNDSLITPNTITCASVATGATCVLVGTYTVTRADADAGSTSNTATSTSPVCPAGSPDPACTVTLVTPVAAPIVSYSKSADTAGPVELGDVITYTLSVTVANAPTTDVVTLTDTLGAGLTFGAVTGAGAYACNAGNPLVCTLPAGMSPGTYSVAYTATVNAQASGTVDNAVIGTSGPSDPTPPVCAANCSTSTPVALPVITVAKSSDPAPGTQVQFGQTITYTLTVTVANAATLADLVLVDTPDPGLTIGALPSGCAMNGTTIRCTLPIGSPAGVYIFAYAGTVNAQAGASVSNQVTATVSTGQPPICDACSITHQILAPNVRLTKVAAVREVNPGDLVRYTLAVENIGATDLVNGSIVDTPAAGFSYVEGSLLVVDGDNAASVEGQSPLRFNGVDVAVGQVATLTYLMRVGAGVRLGTHQNQAQVYGPDGTPISNVATAEVQLVADPMVDDSLVFGTVFDDRDRDGWQDRADLGDVRVQGGFAPGAYIANSTTVDRGAGPLAEADASAPLLHGVDVGAISARQSDADPVENHQVVIRQRLSALTFTDDFVLTSAQGVTVKMDAAGNTTIDKNGEAAKGLNAAAPTVERRTAQGEGGYVIDYVIGNVGIDERGIPGVRIASVEGLLIETDQYGRYHLVGIPGGLWERGRNFLLKVDPSTLPAGAEFTTDNPLLRRITPGIPVRFDWGVKLPVELIEGGTEQVEMTLGEVFFAPGSAKVRAQYLPVIEKIAAKVREYQGGEVVIDANGDTEGLAFDRATAVKQALQALLDAESAKDLVISARGNVDDPASLVVGVDEGGMLLGTVLFDTDKSAIKPEFESLLDKVAAALERMGGGSIAIVGHTDVRASYAYNTALGMRRAKAVYDALAKRLSPAVRARLRVETSDDPSPKSG